MATLTAFSFAACNDDDDADHDHGEHDHDHNADVGPKTGATCPEGSTLTYDTFGKQFMDTYCQTCHASSVKGDARNGAPPDHTFDDLASIDLLKLHIDELAGSGPSSTNTTMPPATSAKQPSKAEREMLSEWLACGPK